MKPTDTRPLQRLVQLLMGILRTPAKPKVFAIALLYGVVCHLLFAAAVLAMIIAMFFGMTQSLGQLAHPWSIVANLALILQFPVVHSLLLSRVGGRVLARLAPSGHGPILATTSYAIIASIQLTALFVFWTPSGVIWWQAEGTMLGVMSCLYGLSWLLLIWASYDAGAEVQSGALGWMSMAQNAKPVFPRMPTRGLFSIIRQPIYVSFAMTTWTVPVWSPDQLCVALGLSAYCLLAPLLKERRFAQRYGYRFDTYKRAVPYAIPRRIFRKRGPGAGG